MKRWLYLLMYIALAGAEMGCLFLLGTLLGGPLYALTLIMLLYPAALAFGRVSLSTGLRFAIELSITGAVIVLVAGQWLYLSIAAGQPDAGGVILRVLFGGLAWWLGHSVPQHDISFNTIALRFQLGFVAVVALSQATGSVPMIFVFFLLAPLALFLARRAGSLSRGAAPLGGVRPVHAALALGSVVVPGVLLLFLLSPGLAGAILSGLGDIFTRLSDWSVSQQQGHDGSFVPYSWSCALRPEQQSTAGSGPAPDFTPAGGGGVPTEAIIWVIAGLCLIMLLALIALALRHARARRQAAAAGPVPFEATTLFRDTAREFIRLFPEMFRRLGRWLRGLFTRRRQHEEPETAPQSIRALYRGFLRWAERQGLARLEAQTPAEHGRLVAQRFPEKQMEAEQITGAYAVARYSRNPAPPELFVRARDAWQRLQTR